MKRSPNAQWDQIVQILEAISSAMPTSLHNVRTVLQLEVEHYVAEARLPVSLQSDPDARHEIAARVVRVLEDNDHAHLREWQRRQQRGREHSSWATFLRVLITQQATLYEQGRRLQLAPLRRLPEEDRGPQ